MEPCAALSETDEAFLDAVLRRALDELANGIALDAALLCADRPHLREHVEHLVARARLGAICRPHDRPVLAGFEIVRELGRGGMGCVYLARQKSLERLVALKILPHAAALSGRARRRFLDEASALARLKHPNVVAVFDIVQSRDTHAYAMEWIEGESLAGWLARERPSLPRICALASSVARALGAVHRAGLLHRDVKPSNLLLRSDGTPVLIDFGLARDDQSAHLTATGEFVGTVAYASPEQLRGESDLDARTDVYSLGVTLFEALAGRLPFAGRNTSAVLASQSRGGAPQLRRIAPRAMSIPRDLETIVSKAIEVDRARRYSSADELADDLDALLALRPIRARPPTLHDRAWRFARRHRPVLVAVVTVLLLASIGAAFGMRSLRERLEAPVRFAEHVRNARLAVLDPTFRIAAFFTFRSEADAADRAETLSGIEMGRPVGLRENHREPLLRALAEYDAAFRLRPPDAELAAERAAVALAACEPASPSASTDRPLVQRIAHAAPDERRALGLLAALTGWPQLAREAWSETDLAPRADPLVDGLMGELLLELDQPAAAWPRLVRAFDTWPDAGMLATSIADAAIRCGDVETAERWLARACVLGHRTLPAIDLRVQAAIWRARGRIDSAIALLEFMERHATTPRAHLDLLDLLCTQGRFEEAFATSLATHDRPGEADRPAVLVAMLAREWLTLSPRQRWQRNVGVLMRPSVGAEAPFERALAAVRRELAAPRPGGSAGEQILRPVASPSLWRNALDDLRTLSEVSAMSKELRTIGRESARSDRILGALGTVARHGCWRAWPMVLIAALASAAFETPANAQGIVWTADGENSGDNAGVVVRSIGDLDGDGVRDALESDLLFNIQSGQVRALSGRTGTLIYRFQGEAVGDQFGGGLASAGDVNADGVEDIVVGAREHIGPKGAREGRVYVYSGKDGSLLRQFDGENDFDLFGDEVSGVGDVNGDGFADVAVGAPAFPRVVFTGIVYVYSGKDGSELFRFQGEAAGDQMGQSIHGPMDFDHDGHSDFVIGAIECTGSAGSQQGRIYLYSGAAGSLLATIDGEAAGDQFGLGLSSADVDGDGVRDILVGAFTHTGPGGAAGAAYVYSGATRQLLKKFDGESSGDIFGARIAGVGDLDGDGKEEIAIASEFHDNSRGRLYLYSGATFELRARYDGDQNSSQFGSDIDGIGDVDGDGIPDILTSARMFDGVSGIDSGRVYVFVGSETEFHLIVTPDSVTAGETVSFETGGGVPFAPYILVVVGVNGVPTWLLMDGIVLLDQDGDRNIQATVPPGLSGLDVAFLSYTVKSRKLVASNIGDLVIQ